MRPRPHGPMQQKTPHRHTFRMRRRTPFAVGSRLIPRGPDPLPNREAGHIRAGLSPRPGHLRSGRDPTGGPRQHTPEKKQKINHRKKKERKSGHPTQNRATQANNSFSNDTTGITPNKRNTPRRFVTISIRPPTHSAPDRKNLLHGSNKSPRPLPGDTSIPGVVSTPPHTGGTFTVASDAGSGERGRACCLTPRKWVTQHTISSK